MRSRAAWSEGRSEDLDGPGVGAEDVHDHPQGGGLAGAVGAEEAEDAAPGDVEGQVGFTAMWPAKALVTPDRRRAVVAQAAFSSGGLGQSYGTASGVLRRTATLAIRKVPRPILGHARGQRRATGPDPRPGQHPGVRNAAHLGKAAYAAGVRPARSWPWRFVIAAVLFALLSRGKGPPSPLRQSASCSGASASCSWSTPSPTSRRSRDGARGDRGPAHLHLPGDRHPLVGRRSGSTASPREPRGAGLAVAGCALTATGEIAAGPGVFYASCRRLRLRDLRRAQQPVRGRRPRR